MPISRKQRRKLKPIARELADLHNQAYYLARSLGKLVIKVHQLEQKLRPYAQHLDRLRGRYLNEEANEPAREN